MNRPETAAYIAKARQSLKEVNVLADALKENADCAIGSEAGLSVSDANQAIDGASRFVEEIATLSQS